MNCTTIVIIQGSLRYGSALIGAEKNTIYERFYLACRRIYEGLVSR